MASVERLHVEAPLLTRPRETPASLATEAPSPAPSPVATRSEAPAPPPRRADPPPAPPAPAAPPPPSSAPTRAVAIEVDRPPPPLSQAVERSPLRFTLLTLAMLAAGVGIVAALLRSGPTDALPPENDPVVLGLPDLVPDASPDAPVDLLASGRPTDDLGALLDGTSLLVFARPTDEPGRASLALAVELHRRLHAHGVRVALVVPRDALTEASAGGAEEEAAVRAALRRVGVATDLTVVVGEGRLRRGTYRFDDENAALLLVEGVETMRVSPPTPSVPLSRAHVAPLVQAALAAQGLGPDGPSR